MTLEVVDINATIINLKSKIIYIQIRKYKLINIFVNNDSKIIFMCRIDISSFL